MPKCLTQTITFSLLSTLMLGFISATAVHAEPLMTKAQYQDYSVQYRCAEKRFHDDLNKKEAELVRIENDFGLNDDNFDEFDELVTEYERDDTLLDEVNRRVETECKK